MLVKVLVKSMDQWKVSVIIPVYNTGKYLKRCLNSVVNNTYKNIEIICINDGSTDDSGKVLETFKKKDNRIVILERKNEGVSAARNAGLRVATGDFVTFIDSDDWVHEKYFEILLKNATNDDIVIGSYKNVMEYEEDSPIDCFEEIQTNALSDCFFNEHVRKYVCGRIYRKNVIDNIYFPREIHLGEDTIYNVKLFSTVATLNVRIINVPLYYYFNRANSAVHVLPPDAFLKKAEWYLDNLDKQYRRKDFLLIEALQTVLVYRYMIYILNDYKAKKTARKLLRFCRRKLVIEQDLLNARKIKYILITILPTCIYRDICIWKDSSLKVWEKIIKEKYKMQRKD